MIIPNTYTIIPFSRSVSHRPAPNAQSVRSRRLELSKIFVSRLQELWLWTLWRASNKKPWKVPSCGPTYPLKSQFWRWFPFPKVGYVSSLEFFFCNHFSSVSPPLRRDLLLVVLRPNSFVERVWNSVGPKNAVCCLGHSGPGSNCLMKRYRAGSLLPFLFVGRSGRIEDWSHIQWWGPLPSKLAKCGKHTLKTAWHADAHISFDIISLILRHCLMNPLPEHEGQVLPEAARWTSTTGGKYGPYEGLRV